MIKLDLFLGIYYILYFMGIFFFFHFKFIKVMGLDQSIFALDLSIFLLFTFIHFIGLNQELQNILKMHFQLITCLSNNSLLYPKTIEIDFCQFG